MGKISESNLQPLQNNYLTTPIPAGQKNISAAYFNLQDVKDLLNSLPNNVSYVKVFLLLENDPVVANQKRMSMGMTGADPLGAKVFADLNGDGSQNEGLLADRPCPPDCHGNYVNARYVSGN